MSKISKKELQQLIHDRSYVIPNQWSPTLLNSAKHKFWRRRIDGLTEYINPQAQAEFNGRYNKKPKVDLRTRKRNIIENQFAILELLETTFLFPANVDFIDNLSKLITERTLTGEKRTNNSVLWFIICMAGFTLLRYFGGTFIQIPKKGFAVRLERVNVEVYIEKKIKSSTYHNFGPWFYDLITALWNQTENGKLFDGESLDYVYVGHTA